MEIAYQLGEEDLREAQGLLLAARRERLRTSPLPFVAAVTVAAVVGSALWGAASPGGASPRRFLLAVAAAAALAALLKPLVERLPYRRLDAWTATWLARLAARRSVLGAVRVSVDAEGLLRRNSAGELRVRWDEVRDVLASPRLLLVRLRRQERVILLPARAFQDAATFAAARARLELRPGAPASAPGVSARRRARPELLIALCLAVLVFALDRATLWFLDPRSDNPAGRVVLYGTAWCPACARLRACLERHAVPFDDRDVERSTRADAEWAALGGAGVPVTLVGQHVVHGLDAGALRAALAAAGHRFECPADAATLPPP